MHPKLTPDWVEGPRFTARYVGPLGEEVTVLSIEEAPYDLPRVICQSGRGTMRVPLSDWKKWLKEAQT